MPTLSEYVEAGAQAGQGLGGWFRFESTAAAVGTDANRTVICADLADEDEGSTAFVRGWLYATDGNVAGQQKRVQAFDGTTNSVGAFFASSPFSAIPASGITWEYSAKLPRNQQGQTPGLREITNQTIRKIWVPDRLTFAGNGTYVYDVAAYPWLKEQAQLGDIYDTSAGSGFAPARTLRPKLRRDAEAPMLDLPVLYGSGQAFSVEVFRPGNSRLKIGGAWADQTSELAGLVDDEDEALVPLDDFVPVFLAYAYAALAWPSPGASVPYWEAKAKDQQAVAGAVKALRLPVDAGGGRLVTTGYGAPYVWGTKGLFS